METSDPLVQDGPRPPLGSHHRGRPALLPGPNRVHELGPGLITPERTGWCVVNDRPRSGYTSEGGTWCTSTAGGNKTPFLLCDACCEEVDSTFWGCGRCVVVSSRRSKIRSRRKHDPPLHGTRASIALHSPSPPAVQFPALLQPLQLGRPVPPEGPSLLLQIRQPRR